MTRRISIYAVITALTVGVSLVFIIPVPGTNGFVTLADAGIYTASLLFGPVGGLTVGALSGGMIDLLSGYPQWIIFSLFIHGFQGWLAGHFAASKKSWQYFGLALGCVAMVVGYALATGFLYGFGAGLASLPTNTAQSVFGAVVAVPLAKAIQHALPKRDLKKEGI
ncbi:ECF transporter S component [Enterococcus faecalis]